MVAGLNYKIQIGIYVGQHCIGGLSSTVFRDLQGTFSVSSYGKELSCEEIKHMLEADGEEDE